MITVRLDQKSKHAKSDIYECQKYTLHECIVNALH